MGFFDFTIWDVINHPISKLTGKTLKLGAEALGSAITKAENEALTPTELTELLNEAQAGNSDAQTLLALHYAENQDYEKFTYWILKSAQQGNEYALQIIDSLQEG